MRGKVVFYQPMIKFNIQLESGHSWGDLAEHAHPIKRELGKVHSFRWVGVTLSRDSGIIHFTCHLKSSASLALAQLRVNKILARHVIGVADGEE